MNLLTLINAPHRARSSRWTSNTDCWFGSKNIEHHVRNEHGVLCTFHQAFTKLEIRKHAWMTHVMFASVINLEPTLLSFKLNQDNSYTKITLNVHSNNIDRFRQNVGMSYSSVYLILYPLVITLVFSFSKFTVIVITTEMSRGYGQAHELCHIPPLPLRLLTIHRVSKKQTKLFDVHSFSTSHNHIILDCLPSLCQKLSDLVEVWRSYNKNNFACFLSHGVVP